MGTSNLPKPPKEFVRPDRWPGKRTSYGKVSNVFDKKTKGDVAPRGESGKTRPAPTAGGRAKISGGNSSKPNDRVANKLEKRTVTPRSAILQNKPKKNTNTKTPGY